MATVDADVNTQAYGKSKFLIDPVQNVVMIKP